MDGWVQSILIGVTEQEIFRRGLYVRAAGVVALPQAPAQWTPIRMAAAGMALRAGSPHRQGPHVKPQRKISGGAQRSERWMPDYCIRQSEM